METIQRVMQKTVDHRRYQDRVLQLYHESHSPHDFQDDPRTVMRSLSQHFNRKEMSPGIFRPSGAGTGQSKTWKMKRAETRWKLRGRASVLPGFRRPPGGDTQPTCLANNSCSDQENRATRGRSSIPTSRIQCPGSSVDRAAGFYPADRGFKSRPGLHSQWQPLQDNNRGERPMVQELDTDRTFRPEGSNGWMLDPGAVV